MQEHDRVDDNMGARDKRGRFVFLLSFMVMLWC